MAEPTMSEAEKKEVYWRVGEDGFDYAFRNYSDFSEVKDTKFHELREAYIKAAQELEAYIQCDLDEDEEE